MEIVPPKIKIAPPDNAVFDEKVLLVTVAKEPRPKEIPP